MEKISLNDLLNKYFEDQLFETTEEIVEQLLKEIMVVDKDGVCITDKQFLVDFFEKNYKNECEFEEEWDDDMCSHFVSVTIESIDLVFDFGGVSIYNRK